MRPAQPTLAPLPVHDVINRPRCAQWAKRRGLLVDDDATAGTRDAVNEQEVLEAIARTPRREFDETIRLQGHTLATGSMIVNELDAVGELLVGIPQRLRHDGPRGSAVLQGGFE